MKKLVFILLALTLLASCASTRKASRDVKETVLDSTSTNAAVSEKTNKAIDTTRTQTGEIMGIPVLDHLVIGDGVYYSFKEHGDL